MSDVEDVIRQLLAIDLAANARKLRLVEADRPLDIDEPLMRKCISILNTLSVKHDEQSRKRIVAIAALLWTYRNPAWDRLQSALILFLSRAGFGPSSIMLDRNYSVDTGSYSFEESLQNMLGVTLAHAANEVQLLDTTLLLTDFQKEIWSGMDGQRLTGISAPTSAGKSYLILMKSIQLLVERPGIIVYIVPTLSLVNQVLNDYRKALDEFGFEDYVLQSTFNARTNHPRTVYVLTQERAIGAFSQATMPFNSLRLLVIDEVQNVERASSVEDERAKVLYDLMIEFRNQASVDHIIISGPRINKIDELGTSVFGLDAVKSETDASPVLNLTYSIAKRNKAYYLTLVTDLLSRPIEVRITNSEMIVGYGKVKYEVPYLDYLDDIVKAFGDECVLLFMPTPDASAKVAGHLARSSTQTGNQYLTELADFISDTVHPDYSLVEAVRNGVAYHHGKLPTHVRMVIEEAIKAGEIRTITCTSTLLQGVNLPVQNIIIRNPNLFVVQKSHSTKLTNYELANLRGRAGRLRKDLVGRSFILDESKFKENESEQLDLFTGSAKEISVGYGTTYREYRSDIRRDIREQIGKTDQNKPYSYLTTYLRQMALRYGINTQSYLSRVGINLSDRELNEVLDSVRGLSVDRDLCARNRYWDPVDLDALRRKASRINVPTGPFDSRLAYGLETALDFLGREFAVYYDRHFGIRNTQHSNILTQKCIMAQDWVREKLLKDILTGAYYNDTDRIDYAVESLERTISYKMVLILKPLYDVLLPESVFPRFIELGAYKPLTRRFIELNIPRETAIYIGENNTALGQIDPEDRQALIAELRRQRPRLSRWHQMQLRAV